MEQANAELNLHEILEAECKKSDLQAVTDIAKGINADIKNAFDVVLHIGGRREGLGKSSLAILMGIVGDQKFDLRKNVIYTPDFDQINTMVYGLPFGSYISYDEAVQAFTKMDRFENFQTKLVKLFVRCRKQFKVHMLCMPDITDYRKEFRIRRIRWWFELIDRGKCIVLKSDRVPGNPDPWHLGKWNKFVEEKRAKLGRNYALESSEETADMLRQHGGYVGEFSFPALPEAIYNAYLSISKEHEQEGFEQDVTWERKVLCGVLLNGINKLTGGRYTEKDFADMGGISDSTVSNCLHLLLKRL